MIEMPTTVSSQEALDVFIDLLRDHLHATGETQAALAARAGVRREMVARLVNGKYDSSPSFDNISRLAKAIGFQPRWEHL